MPEARTINPKSVMKLDKRMCSSSNKIKKKKKRTALISSSKPFRRARTKIKKPKFLTLSNAQLQMVEANKQHHQQQKKQLDLFPICKDEHEKEEEPASESMADHMFAEDGPTLNGLLNGTVSSTTSGLSYATAVQDSVNSARSLVRTAMRRSRERDEESEEKWVSISKVVERRSVELEVAEEEVTSGGGCGGAELGAGGLWLKLDYEEVLNAWSGERPFYVEAEEDEQTVPDLHLDQYGVVPFWVVRDKGCWSIPENNFNGQSSGNLQTDEEKWKLGLREASVLRYKEKRQSRLFSKRIRYEVRKLNAEKRPRIKGRFVKRCEKS